jgi:hypothetical protein
MTLATRIIAAIACAGAGGYLLTLMGDRGTRSARWFTACGFLGNAVMFVVAAFTHPLEGLDTALFISAVARVFTIWQAVGVILVVRQRRLLGQGGLR